MSHVILLAYLLAGCDAPQAVRSLSTRPVAVRGGVLLLPLSAPPGAAPWPQTLRLGLAERRPIDGLVAFVHPAVPRAERRWTDESTGPAVSSSPPGGPPQPAIPYFLARLPGDGRGAMRLGSQVLHPHWIDPPSPRPPESPDVLERTAGHDRPDAYSPWEHWRWTVLAERLGLKPPAPDCGNEGANLIAEHPADLWRVGLARLAAASPRAAVACAAALVGTCRDGDVEFAAWVADPVRTAALLSILLDFDLSDRSLVDAALAWLDSQERVLVWPEPGHDDQVTLALANAGADTIVATLTWLEGDSIPVGAELPPGIVTRVRVDRPARVPRDAERGDGGPDTAPPEQVLLVDVKGRERRLSFQRAVLQATPPGLFLGPLRPPLTLLESQGGWAGPIPPGRSTLAHFRRLDGRWEIYLECRRPSPRAAAGDREAVTILLGTDDDEGPPASATRVVLLVPENGPAQVLEGPSDPGLQVHRRSHDDRWLCRVVLPDAWLPAARGEPLLLGLARTHASDDGVETGPHHSLPWRAAPGRVAIDLAAWDQ